MSPWKSDIIKLTESPEAKAAKIDASFFPPASEDQLRAWESQEHVEIPAEIRSYLSQSDGLEAQRGEIWPVLPLVQWEMLHDECASSHPWIRFGETREFHYLLSLGHSPSIYRYARFGSEEEFFAPGFRQFLAQIFRGSG